MRRIMGVAAVRAREGLRGPVTAFLLLYLALAGAAAVAAPGEAGVERQRAVDGFALDAALFTAVLAAAVLGATSLAADRDSGREPWLRATALRDVETLVGGLLGHAAALGVLLAGMLLGFLATSGLLAGGHRAPTRVALRAEALLDGAGRPAERGVLLTRAEPEATFVLPARRADLAEGPDCRAYLMLAEFAEDLDSLPDEYPVAVRVDDGPERVLLHRTGDPLEFDLEAGSVRAEGGTRIAVRRVDPSYTLGLAPGGLLAQGHPRSFPLNALKAVLAILLALLPLAAAGAALSTCLGAPVGAAGALLFALVAKSAGFIREAASYADSGASAAARFAARTLDAAAKVLPDLADFDLSVPVVARWDVPPAQLLGLLPFALAWAAAFLVFGLIALAVRRRL